MNLSDDEQMLHDRAVKLGRSHRRLEGHVLSVVQEIARTKLHRRFGKSMFAYLVAEMGFSESVTACLITVSRKAASIPVLHAAIVDRAISVSKASRIVSSITLQNAEELIEFAKTHTDEEINREVARRDPQAVPRDRVKFISETVVQLTVCVSIETYTKLQRAQSLEAQRNHSGQAGPTIGEALVVYLNARDPLCKAERRSRRKTAEKCKKLCANSVYPGKAGGGGGSKLKPAVRQAALLRDGGRCTGIDEYGKRCCLDRWLDVHHIIPTSRGGTDDLANLTTLCRLHHILAHELIEAQDRSTG